MMLDATGEPPATLLVGGRRDAATAHSPQQNHPRPSPGDFPQRLARFKEESGLPWAESAGLLGVYPHTIWRWQSAGIQPNGEHMMALQSLTDDLGLGHLFTD